MPLQLPQPQSITNHPPYQYILEEQVATVLFPRRLVPGTLCFVTHGTNVCHKRARVVLDDDERVLVRYPKGSTYRVRRCNIHPILYNNAQSYFVMIHPETPAYRTSCVTHTHWTDVFLEIGCDFGQTVARVQRGVQQGGIVPMLDKPPLSESDDLGMMPVSSSTGTVQCLGIDKSQVSIDIAKERYPQCMFSLEDALTEEGTKQLRTKCQDVLYGGYPTVVAIDINGNREIPAVLQCLEHLMNPIDPPEGWMLPRLIIVKSRLLHHAMVAEQLAGEATR